MGIPRPGIETNALTAAPARHVATRQYIST